MYAFTYQRPTSLADAAAAIQAEEASLALTRRNIPESIRAAAASMACYAVRRSTRSG